MDENIAIVGQ